MQRNEISAGEPIRTTFIVLIYNKERFLKRRSVTMASTNGHLFLKSPIDIQLQQRIHSSYYFEMDFGICGMDRLTLKQSSLKLILTMYFY